MQDGVQRFTGCSVGKALAPYAAFANRCLPCRGSGGQPNAGWRGELRGKLCGELREKPLKEFATGIAREAA